MPSIRSLLLNCLLITRISSYAITSIPSNEKDEQEALADAAAFQKLLDQVDPPALHAALHDYSPRKFKHGVFREDRTAVEAVHRDDAPLATTIVSVAKRQEASLNSTAVATITEVSTTITEIVINPSTVAPNPVQPSDRSTQQATPVPLPNPQTSAPAGPSPSASPGSPSSPGSPASPGSPGSPSSPGTPASPGTPGSPASASAGSPAGSSSAGASNVPASPNQPSQAPGAPSTTAAGNAPEQTSGPGTTNGVAIPSVPLAPGPVSVPGIGFVTSGQVITTTNAAGVTIITTIDGGVVTLSGQGGAGGSNPTGSAAGSGSGSDSTAGGSGGSETTALVLQTTTLPDGSQSTITAFTVVSGAGGNIATPTGSAGVAGTTTGPSGSLQSAGLAPRSRTWGWEVVGVMGGAVGFAIML